jgi:alkylation response protein AidB-like acyl-CoA dehydrogenase
MDFQYHYTKQQEEFRKEVRAWLDANIPEPMKAPVDREELTKEQYQFWRVTHQKLAEKGWLYPTYPKEYGGGGLTGEHETIIMEEFRRARVVGDFTNSLVAPTLLVWGTEEQKRKFLTPMLKAQKVFFQNFTEPNAGSDLASLQSRAVREGNDWVITGQKVYITGVNDPDYLFGPMMTDADAPRHRNLGYFLIPFPSPGLEMRRQDLLNGHNQSFVFMDRVRVPADHLIGGDHQGWQVTQTTLEVEHGGRGAVFPRDETVDNLLDYMRSATQNGHALINDPVLQQKAVETYIDSHVSALFSKRNYWMYQSHREMSYHGSQTSLWGKEYRMRNADRIREVMNMYALAGTKEPRGLFKGEPEVFQRNSLVQAHPAGTIEVQKVIIARRIGISRTRERAAATPSTVGARG